MSRTTEEHRAAVEAWRATAPAHDHQIFGRKLKAEKPRHRDLSELSALLAMRARPIGVAEGVGVTVEPIPPISTNWRLAPANDNEPPHEDADVERVIEIVPSVDMIMREVGQGDIEYGLSIDENGKRHKVITHIGSLRFSDGSQMEKGQKLVLDKVVDADIRMPVGAMLDCREKSARDKGAETDAAGSNSHYRWLLKAGRVATPPKLTPKKVERVTISKAEARKMLADAYANTSVLPMTKICPDGLPYGPSNLRQLFIGGRKGKNGETGSQAWQDIYTEKENRETFNRGLDAMQDEHVRVLTETTTAKSLSELGEARGYHGRHAIDAGRRLLRAANDNFQAAMSLAEYAAEVRREVSCSSKP
ncbi:hypothetical protein [Rhizobium sp. P44RR-XXIV]|uniref:hypothetical protein n=1 Tax=Rhizobium sp. P44RR-XXIV TaxID=1921145 RepID=UPI0009843223|nr:hypothetical protein [Rhizobium sp. P44RR-XXIV]TIX89203.1 hypothetical protein BSK43_021605 [Rhizobium sp. P44RR-XXIV]